MPVHPSAKAYRKKAIQLLGKTFHEAIAVLILDRELEIVESATTSFLELGLRVLFSGWVKRLWTLQEATLASEGQGADKLYFQLRDGPSMYQKYDRERKALQRRDEHTREIVVDERRFLRDDGVMLLLGEQIPSIPTMRAMRPNWSPFEVIYAAIEHRSTSKVEDIPICIASLMGKDLSTIISAPNGEERMGNFYKLMREVPIAVLWQEESIKLSIAPFRWAPKSITSCPKPTYSISGTGRGTGVCDATGFHVSLYGFAFLKSELEQHGVGPDVTLPRVFSVASAATGNVFRHLWLPPDRTREIPLQSAKLALLFRPFTGVMGVDPAVAVVVVESAETVMTTDDDNPQPIEVTGRIIGYLHDYLYGAPPDPLPECVFRGHMTSDKQRWCLT